jgi:hypothetical protein
VENKECSVTSLRRETPPLSQSLKKFWWIRRRAKGARRSDHQGRDHVPVGKRYWRQLEKWGEDIAYAYAIAEDDIMLSKLAVGKDAADIKALLLVVLINQDGAVAGRAVLTDEAIGFEVIAMWIIKKQSSTWAVLT